VRGSRTNPPVLKRFGQHFLVDRSALEAIANAVVDQPGDTIIEIGPGRGALTDILAVETVRALWRDTLTVRTVKGRFQLRAFMARRFGARLEIACVARLGRATSGALRPLAA